MVMGWTSRAARKNDLADGAERRRAWDAQHPEFALPASRERLARLIGEAAALPEPQRAACAALVEKAARVIESAVAGFASMDMVRAALDAAETSIVEARAATGRLLPDARLAKGVPHGGRGDE